MMNLTREDINSLSKSFILERFHRFIRPWYISDKLPKWMLGDQDIKPYFTPCSGHSTGVNLSDDRDEIDGVLPMMAYCSSCCNGTYIFLC